MNGSRSGRASSIWMRTMLLLAAAVACGCRAPAPVRSATLSVAMELAVASFPIEGEIATFDIRIRNDSKHYVLLRDLVEPGTGSIVTWQVSKPGTLEFLARSGEFEYDPRRPAAQPRPAFNVSLLCPGEELLLRPRVRLLQLPRTYLANYFLLDRRELSADVYFEERAPGERGRFRYRRLSGEALDLALAPREAQDPAARRALASHRTVVFPHAETILETPRQELVRLDVPGLQRRAFTLEDAAARAGTTPADVGGRYTFYSAADAWVLRTPSGPVLVRPNAKQPLPDTNNLDTLYYILDTAGGGSLTFAIRTPIEVRLEPHGFRILATGEPPYKYTLHAGAADIPRLLRALADEKLRIDVEPQAGALRLFIRRG